LPRLITKNMEIRELPASTNNLLATLAKVRGCHKWEVVRDAMVEYVKNHASEIRQMPELSELEAENGEC
jgi:hypothetical protein